jgi:hypothetical protein
LATNTWDGSESANWNTANNWSSGSIPGNSDNVVIPNVGTDPILNASDQVGALLIQSGGLLTINNGSYKLTASSVTLADGGSLVISAGELESTGKMEAFGTLTMSGGTLDVNGNFELSATSAESISGGSIYCAGNWDGENAANYTLTGGSVVLDGGTSGSYNTVIMDNISGDVGNSFSGNSYFNNLTVSGYYKNSTYIPYIKGALTISNGFTYDTYGVRVFLEGDLVTSGSGTSSWSSTGAGILSNTQADMYLHLLGSGNQTIGSFNDEDIGIAPYKGGGNVTANGYIGPPTRTVRPVPEQAQRDAPVDA